MRCPECNKFVPFGDGNVDDIEVEIDEDTGVIDVTGRVVLPCEECDTELKELTVEEQVETEELFKRTVEVEIESASGTETATGSHTVKYEFVGDPDVSYHERKAGKKVTKGVAVSGKVRRTITKFDTVWPDAKLEEEADVLIAVTDSPSSFDELV